MRGLREKNILEKQPGNQRPLVTSTTLKTIVNANNTRSGAIEESSDAITLLEVFEEVVISSLEESKVIRSTAINTPPIPPITIVDMDIALDTAEVLDAVLVTVTIADSIPTLGDDSIRPL